MRRRFIAAAGLGAGALLVGVPVASALVPTVNSVDFTLTKKAGGTPGLVEVGDTLGVTMVVARETGQTLAGGRWWSCKITAAPVVTGGTDANADPCKDPGDATSITPNPAFSDSTSSSGTITVAASYTVQASDAGRGLLPMLFVPNPNAAGDEKAWTAQIPVATAAGGSTVMPWGRAQPVDAGQTVIFQPTIFASPPTGGTNRLSYAWERKSSTGSWAAISGANAATYTTPALTADDNGAQYRITVTNDPTIPGLETGSTTGTSVAWPAWLTPGTTTSTIARPITVNGSSAPSDNSGSGSAGGTSGGSGSSPATGAQASTSPVGTVNSTPVPIALEETARTAPGARVVVDPFLNDAASAGATPDRTSVVLRDPKTGKWVRSVRVAGVGTWTVNAATGAITLTPVASYSGTTPAVDYRFADSTGKADSSTVAVTVARGAGANPVTVAGMINAPLPVSPLLAMPGGAAAWTPASLRIRDPRTGKWTASVTVAGQGTYVVDTVTGRVVFTPVADFHGIATPLRFRVAGKGGTVGSSTINPIIRTLAPMLVSTTDMPSKVVRVGDVLRVTVKYRNLGGAVSQSAQAEVQLPAGLVSEDEKIANADGPRLTWTVDPLDPGQAKRRVLLLRVTEEGPLSLKVRIPGATATGADSTGSVRALPATRRIVPVTG